MEDPLDPHPLYGKIMPPPGWPKEPWWLQLLGRGIAKGWDWFKQWLPVFVAAALSVIWYFLYRDNLNPFLVSVGTNWLHLLEGSAATVVLMVTQAFLLKKPISRAWWAVVFLLLMLFACFQSWEGEYLSRIAREKDFHVIEIKLARLEGQLTRQEFKEPTDSLRRRATQLVDDVEIFLSGRQVGHPAYTTGKEAATIEQQKINRASEAYDTQTQSTCAVRFHERMAAIAREMRSKGLDVRWLDSSVHPCSNDQDLSMMRELAFHLDEHDNAVRF